MAFARFVDPSLRFVQWVDEVAARGWLAVLRVLVAREYPADAAARWSAQTDLWRALSGFYLACDLPPTSDPGYRNACCARLGCDGSVGSWRVDLGAMLARHSPEYREAIADGVGFRFDLVQRQWLSPSGTIFGAGQGAVAPPARGSDNYRTGCNAGESGAECWAWHEWVPGAFDAAPYGEVNAMVPMRASWELAREVAQSVVDAGLVGVLARARAWSALTNLRTARALGLEVPAELAGIAASEQAERFRTDPTAVPVSLVADGVLAPLAILVAGGLPLAGALLGVVAGIPYLLQALFGRAVGFSTDPWGRREPVFQPTAISGGGTSPPVHEVPAPPSVAAASTGPLWLGELVPVPLPDVVVLEDSGTGAAPGDRASSSGGKLLLGGALALLLYSSAKGRS